MKSKIKDYAEIIRKAPATQNTQERYKKFLGEGSTGLYLNRPRERNRNRNEN